MLLSPEIRRSSCIALSFREFWAAFVCRYRVRRAEFGGVGDHGRVSQGLAWNTGLPSRTLEHESGHLPRCLLPKPDIGRHRISTTKGGCGKAQAAARKETLPYQTDIFPHEPTKREGNEASRTLRLPIVAFEIWRTAPGQDPVSSEGGVPNIGTSAPRHGLNPPRK
jgi:hypothetical protein